MKKKLVFLTGTRADYGKLKSILNSISQVPDKFELYIFVTGMHMMSKYGSTFEEVLAGNFGQYFTYVNQNTNDTMDTTLAKTISGFSDFVKEIQPDLIVVHGDRVEALAGAIVGSLNNILVSHIEGGEVSGTVDELLRHAISKLSHIHFVANKEAKKRLLQLGELNSSIYVIGSPDIDVMVSKSLPSIDKVVEHYDTFSDDYSVVLFHPVTTEFNHIEAYAANLVNALLKCKEKFVVIYPNNDLGSEQILTLYNQLRGNDNFRLYPSMRFEYFLVLLKNARCVIGNSSAGVRETPFYGVPSVNVGTRQNMRSNSDSIINCGYSEKEISSALRKAYSTEVKSVDYSFGEGNSSQQFLEILNREYIWSLPSQKYFVDLDFVGEGGACETNR